MTEATARALIDVLEKILDPTHPDKYGYRAAHNILNDVLRNKARDLLAQAEKETSTCAPSSL